MRAGDLYLAPGEESEPPSSVRLTFSGGRLSSPILLSDGRLLLTLAAERGDVAVTIHPDGTWMTPFVDDGTVRPIPWEAAAAAPVLPSIVKPERTTGYLVVFDVARTDDPTLPPLRGVVEAVRVVARDGSGRILAEVAPAADGSLFLELPADRPLGLELVTGSGATVVAGRSSGATVVAGRASGATLAVQETPFWVRPNERRACLGCHVASRYAPPNVRPLALLEEARRVEWGTGE